MFSFGYSFFLSGPIIGYTSLSYFYIFSIVFYMIHYFDTIAKHPFLVALQMHPYQCRGVIRVSIISVYDLNIFRLHLS